jgi:hypothetical protein
VQDAVHLFLSGYSCVAFSGIDSYCGFLSNHVITLPVAFKPKGNSGEKGKRVLKRTIMSINLKLFLSNNID